VGGPGDEGGGIEGDGELVEAAVVAFRGLLEDEEFLFVVEEEFGFSVAVEIGGEGESPRSLAAAAVEDGGMDDEVAGGGDLGERDLADAAGARGEEAGRAGVGEGPEVDFPVEADLSGGAGLEAALAAGEEEEVDAALDEEVVAAVDVEIGGDDAIDALARLEHQRLVGGVLGEDEEKGGDHDPDSTSPRVGML
jgi:hypothetical protein